MIRWAIVPGCAIQTYKRTNHEIEIADITIRGSSDFRPAKAGTTPRIKNMTSLRLNRIAFVSSALLSIFSPIRVRHAQRLTSLKPPRLAINDRQPYSVYFSFALGHVPRTNAVRNHCVTIIVSRSLVACIVHKGVVKKGRTGASAVPLVLLTFHPEVEETRIFRVNALTFPSDVPTKDLLP